jgi:hypothetical protein
MSIEQKEALEKKYYSYVVKVFVLSIIGLIAFVVTGYMVYRLFTDASTDNFFNGSFVIMTITMLFAFFIKFQINKYKKNMAAIAADIKKLGFDVPEL